MLPLIPFVLLAYAVLYAFAAPLPRPLPHPHPLLLLVPDLPQLQTHHPLRANLRPKNAEDVFGARKIGQ